MQKTILGRVGDYSIRQCASEDIPTVIEINMKTLPEHYSDYFYYEVLSEHPETFLVAEIGGKVIGYIMCRIEYGFSHLKRLGLAHKGHIISVAVLEEHRGRGLGSELIDLAQQELTKKACTECYLEVRVSNGGGIELYKRMNFEVVGKLDSYYRDGEAAYLMANNLRR